MIYNRFFFPLAMICVIFVFTIDIVCAQTEKIENRQDEVSSAKIVKLGKNIFQIGTTKINKKERFAAIKGEINMSDGLVEYLACNPKGKLHESVLTLFAEPYHIQMALLLLGLTPGDMPIEFQGAPKPPCGDPVNITISWEENGKIMEYPPEQLVINIKDKKNMEKVDWVFTGSKILDGQYMAQIEGSIAAVFHDPFAIFDHRSITGADDTLYFANKNILPSVGTPVLFKIFAETDPKVKERVRCKK